MLKSIYFLTSGDPSMIHMSLKEAIKYAEDNNLKEISKIRVSNYTIPQIYNGHAGFVLEDTLVWTNPNFKQESI